MSEYGFQGFPDLSTIRKFTSPEDRVLRSAVMKAHQKHPTGYETIDEYLLRDYKKPKDFESYAYVSQLLQAEGMKTAIEAHRRAKPYCMGTMYWQLNDSWPVVSWSSRDYYGKKKALQYALPDVFSNILISPVLEDGHVRVYISSDEYLPIVGIMTVKLMDFEGNMYADEGFSIEIPGNTSLVYYDTLQANYLGKLKPEEVLCLVTFNGGMYGGKHKRLLYFVPPKDLSLPVPVISKKVTPSKDGYAIEISSDKLARNVFITTTIKGDFSNNYFDLLPGESVEVLFKTSKKVARMEDQIVVKSLVDSYQ